MLARLFRLPERAPKTERRIRFGQHEFGCREGKTLLDAALDAGVPMSYSCQVGACGTCRCRVVSGSFRTLKSLEYLLGGEELRSGVTLACQTLPESDLVLEPGGVTQPASVVSCLPLGSGVVELRVAPSSRVAYQLGQFVELGTPSGVVRPFSMVDLGDVPDAELEFHVKLRPGGAMSRFLVEEAGSCRDGLRLSEPQGEVESKANRSYERVLCFAGGSGLGVCASVARAMTLEGRATAVDYLTVSRTGSSEYHEHLLGRASGRERGRTERVAYAELFEREPSRLRQLRDHLARCPDTLAVLCGSSTLVERGFDWLERAGLTSERIWVIPFSRGSEAGASLGGSELTWRTRP